MARADRLAGSVGVLFTAVILMSQDVGCDAVLGSGAVVDQCGVCGGDGSTCRVISGIFTRTHLKQYGYHHVATIPRGACNINITELAQSRNFLALRTPDGSNIMNSNKQLMPIGKYDGAGTTFDYRKRSGLWCPAVCIFADGPLSQPVEIQLLYYDRNPGIMYHFTVPQDTATAVMNSANNMTHSYHRPHHSHHGPHSRQPQPQQHQDGHQRQSHRYQNGDQRQSQPHRSVDKTASAKHGRNARKDTESLQQHREVERGDKSVSVGSSNTAKSTSTSLRDAPGYLREGLSPRRRKQRPSSSVQNPRTYQGHTPRSPAEDPQQPRRPVVSRQASVASAPHYVPPEHEGAPIQYKHYYHVGSDDYRQHSQRAAFNSPLNHRQSSHRQLSRPGGAGAEALSRPNIIPASRRAGRRWRHRVDTNNDINSVGDIPLSVPASGHFVWTISGFSACSQPCGGGSQQTVVVCMKSDTRVVVMAENCDLNARPTPTTVECNTQPCDAKWTAGEWSECSVTCGHGIQTRVMECQQRISPTLKLRVSADRCTDQKPPVNQFCRRPVCFQWKPSNWTKCSTDCGLGERTRSMSCINGEGREVSDGYCEANRPKTREICDMGSCAKGWYYTRWSKKCSPKCGGKAHKTRKVYCAAENGGSLPGDRCPVDKKPRSRKSCGSTAPCGGKWFSGPWSECNSTCGKAWRTREVVCMKKHGRRLWSVVDKENCLRKERPPSKEICPQLTPCQSEWFMTHWSECSKPCDTGSKTREVKCLDADLQPSLTCTAKRRPRERRACNKHSCNNTTTGRHGRNKQGSKLRHVQAPQRYQESTSANTTYQQYHKNKSRQPMALQAPVEMGLQQDVRSAMGDDHESNHRRRPHSAGPHQHRPHHQHHSSVGSTTAMPVTQSTSQTTQLHQSADGGPHCMDKQSSRWCLFVSQARLCSYGHYKKQCCKTCRKYYLNH